MFSALRYQLLYFDPYVRRFALAIADKRVSDAVERCHADFQKRGDLEGYPGEPPWMFPLDDPRYSMQMPGTENIWGAGKFLQAPEWMIALTCREIVLVSRSSAWSMGGGHYIEYRLTRDNRANAYLPSKGPTFGDAYLSPTEYLWARLEHYFGITQSDPCLFTTELLDWSLLQAGTLFRTNV